MPAAAILDFFRSQICNGPTVTRAELLHRAKFCWNCGRDTAIFRFFKMATAAMLDFWNYKVLTVGRIIIAELRHRAKFRGDWSNRCHDILILDFSRCWLQSREWVTQSDPWPNWPIKLLTHDPCDPWSLHITAHRHRASHPILAQALHRFIDYPALHLDIVYVHTPLSYYITARVGKLHTQIGLPVNLDFAYWKLKHCIT